MVHEAETTHGDPSRVPNGYSPGGAAVELGISRQAVHKAIRRGTLDAFHIPQLGGLPGYYLIPQDAVDAYKRRRRTRSNQSDLFAG